MVIVIDGLNENITMLFVRHAFGLAVTNVHDREWVATKATIVLVKQLTPGSHNLTFSRDVNKT